MISMTPEEIRHVLGTGIIIGMCIGFLITLLVANFHLDAERKRLMKFFMKQLENKTGEQ